ncbi:hypothetical protein D3C87_1841880 [compost metagenome]
MPEFGEARAGIRQSIGAIAIGIEFGEQPAGRGVQGVQLDDGIRIDGAAIGARCAVGQHLVALLFGEECHGFERRPWNASATDEDL